MSDIHTMLDQLDGYPATLSELAGSARDLAKAGIVFTTVTGREDSAAASAGLAEHVRALLGDVGTAMEEDGRRVTATLETLLAVEHEIGAGLARLL